MNSSVTYRAIFTVDVEVTVPEEAITRVLENHDGWQEQFYRLDERGVVEMLARNCGIHGSRLNQLDGWADMQPDVSKGRITSYEMDDYERVTPKAKGA